MTDPTAVEAARRRLAAYRALPEEVRREREDRASVPALLASIETATPIDEEGAS